jgi:hypothetical protein
MGGATVARHSMNANDRIGYINHIRTVMSNYYSMAVIRN